MVEGGSVWSGTLIAQFEPRLRGTTLDARVPFAELGSWPRETAL